MTSTNYRRKLFTTIAIVVFGFATLLLLSYFERWIGVSVFANFNIAVNPETGSIGTKDTDASVTATSLMFASLFINLIKIIKVIIQMVIVIAVVKLISQLIFDSAISRTGQKEIGSLVRTIVSVIIYIVAFFIIFQYQYPNIPLAPLFTGSTILGIVVGLALQDTLGNLFAGVAIQADQGFQVGDVIMMQEHGMGIVESVSWRGVRLRTFQDKILLMSNSEIGKATIEIAQKNYLNARLIHFNTIYSNSPAKVIQVVREAVRQVENVSPKRRPKVRICNLGDNGIDWEVKYWITNYRLCNDTDALIRERIWYAFQRENLDFAFPTRTIYNAEVDTSAHRVTEASDEICDRIADAAIFAPLSDEETNRIAKGCSIRVFAPNEPIIQAGEDGKSMYVVHHGSVNVQIEKDGQPTTVNELHEGDFFGEMSLFTGNSRRASVVADSETEVLEIKPFVLKPILDSNPEVARIIGEIIEERQSELLASIAASEKKDESEEGGIGKSIRKLFGVSD